MKQIIEAINNLQENFRLGKISFKEFANKADFLYCTLHLLQNKKDAKKCTF